MAYFDNVNTTLLELVSPNAQKILELGCGAGALARAIKNKLPSVHYSGIELVNEQLGLAADVLDFALVRNLDQMGDWSQDAELNRVIPPKSLDHVIFGDVLEHLYDPQAALNQAATRLAPNGSALVCIPNVQHWSVFVQLILGSWPQSDAGLFDRTHIRWFALADMVKLIETVGLKVEHIEERIFAPEVGLPFLEDLEALARTLGVDPNLVIERGLPLQYVLVGKKIF